MLPFSVILKYGNTVIPSINKIKRFSVANNGSAVLLHYANGDLYALGTNSNSRFGTGDATAITGAWRLIASNVREYTCSHNAMILIKNDGTSWYSGSINNVFTASMGYTNIATSTVFVSFDEILSQFNIATIKKIEMYQDGGYRCFVIDGTGQMWAAGSNQYYAMGIGGNTASVNWTMCTGITNAAYVYPTLNCTWVKMQDGTFYRAGTNSYGTLASGSTSSTTLQVFDRYTAFNIKDITVTQYNVNLLTVDGLVKMYGSSSSGQMGNGSTSAGTFYTPYQPSLTNVQKLSDYTGSFYSSYVIGSTSLLTTGQNNSGMLGVGNSNSTITSFTDASTGMMGKLEWNKLSFYNYASSTGFAVLNNEIYCTGAPAMTLLSANAITWTLMNTPLSQKWSVPKLSTVENITQNSVMRRYSHSRCALDANRFVIVGGYNGSIMNDIQIYNSSTNTFTAVPVTSSTQNRFGAGVSMYGGYLYIFAGNNGSSSTTNAMYKVDINTGEWELLTTTGTPTARSHVRMCTVGEMMYIWGGENISQLYSFNPKTNVFTLLGTSPYAATIDADMCTDGTNLYVNTNNAFFHMYNISSGKWIQLWNKPTSGGGKIEYNSDGYIYLSSAAGLYAYGTQTNIWTTISTTIPLNTTRQCISCAGGRVYYTGGITSSDTLNLIRIS